MPFVANTPESFMGRSDSRNPNSTCRGITASGRPCRRPVTAVSAPSLRAPKTPDLSDEDLYCWQHKEQASRSAKSSPGPRGTATPILEDRTSLDTLADRLGLIELQEKSRVKGKRRHTGLLSPDSPTPPQRPVQASRKKDTPKLQFCCCFSVPIEEIPEKTKPRPQPRPVQHPTSPLPQSQGRKSKQRLDGSSTSPYPASPGQASQRSRKSTASHTAQLKDLIPDTLDAPTASALMAELARPYVDSEEAGFIYMFWLTPTNAASPPVDAARNLLAPPSPSRNRRASDVVSRFAVETNDATKSGKKTMLLKIGRAANVQRRMNQWQRQCGYDIEMLRYYPYVASAEESSGVVPTMTAHAHRVERLVHIELAGMGFKASMDTCEACGRDHREWFEVSASRAGIRRVDEVIRKWIDWDKNGR